MAPWDPANSLRNSRRLRNLPDPVRGQVHHQLDEFVAALLANAGKGQQIVGAGAEHLRVVQAPQSQVAVDAGAGGFGGVVGPEVAGKHVQRLGGVQRDPGGGDARARGARRAHLVRGEPREVRSDLGVRVTGRLRGAVALECAEELGERGLAHDGYPVCAGLLRLAAHGVWVRSHQQYALAGHVTDVEAGGRRALRPNLVRDVQRAGEGNAVAGGEGELGGGGWGLWFVDK